MDRRKDTPFQGTKLPAEYLKLVESVFNKNFAKQLLKEKDSREIFVAHGEMYPDEVMLCISLKNQNTLRMTSCYASVDYPPPQLKTEAGVPAKSTSEHVQLSVSQCVDGAASFFNTFFEEGRPLDFDEEYRQSWTAVELEKNLKVYLRINRDNPELELAADEILKQDAEVSKKKKLH